MSHNAPSALDAAAVTIPKGHAFGRFPLIFGGGGLALLAVSLAVGHGGSAELLYPWLVSFLYVASIALGCLYFVLVHYAMQGGWGVVVRRIAENAVGTLPVVLLLVVPVLLGMREVFPWVRGLESGHDAVLKSKAAYLNPSFFLLRAAVYLVLWSAIGLLFVRTSRRQDVTGAPALSLRLKRIAGPCLIALALTHSFAAFDWIMSLDPHWYSTMFGVYAFAGSLLSGFAFVVLVVMALRSAGLLRDIVNEEHFHDLGKLLFAFTVFWGYIGFSQYFLIWYANIPEETIFFRERMAGSWSGATFLLAAGHFVVPFFFMMPRAIKRKAVTLGIGAAWILAMHFLDLEWLVLPGLRPHGYSIGLLDVTTLLGAVGVFLGAFSWLTLGAPLVPVKDPRLPESLGFENV